MARFSLGFSLFAVCVSIGSFVAVQLQSNPAPWEPTALNRFGYVLVALAVALALVVGRASAGGWQAQIVAAVVAVGFASVALTKLPYDHSHLGLTWSQALQWGSEAAAVGLGALAFGLIGPRDPSLPAQGRVRCRRFDRGCQRQLCALPQV